MPRIPKNVHKVKSIGRVHTPKVKNWLRNPEDGAFYNSRKWRGLSLRYKKFHPVCQVENCTQPSYYTDHIVPISEGGGKWDWSNFQALCKRCNARKTAKQKTKFANK